VESVVHWLDSGVLDFLIDLVRAREADRHSNHILFLWSKNTKIKRVVSQLVHELLAAPEHGGIGAEVSAFAQAQYSPNVATLSVSRPRKLVPLEMNPAEAMPVLVYGGSQSN
jgi:hypothetical protein